MSEERRHDIDWLRVLAMLTIFLFHCARSFDDDFWHVKNNQLTEEQRARATGGAR